MEIIIHGVNDNLSKKEQKYAVEFFGNVLLGKRLARNIYLEVFNEDFEKEDMGFCNPTDWDYRNHRDFEILLNRNLSHRLQLVTLAHEMVHVKQFARNEMKFLDGDYYKWMGKKMYLPKKKFERKYKQMQLPWEREASQSEPWLMHFWKQHCKLNELEFK